MDNTSIHLYRWEMRAAKNLIPSQKEQPDLESKSPTCTEPKKRNHIYRTRHARPEPNQIGTQNVGANKNYFQNSHSTTPVAPINKMS